MAVTLNKRQERGSHRKFQGHFRFLFEVEMVISPCQVSQRTRNIADMETTCFEQSVNFFLGRF